MVHNFRTATDEQVAVEEIRQIFNQSFEEGECPQIWRGATILPILPASEVDKFHTVWTTGFLTALRYVKLVKTFLGVTTYPLNVVGSEPQKVIALAEQTLL